MEKCKTKLVPKLVANQKINWQNVQKTNWTRNRSRKQGKNESTFRKKKKKLNKQSKKDNERLVKTLTNAYCNPGCKGTLFQEDGFDAETFVKENICKKDPTCDAKNFVKLFKNQRKTFTKNRKRILTDDSFFYAFVNKTKKARLIKDGALSGCALTAL